VCFLFLLGVHSGGLTYFFLESRLQWLEQAYLLLQKQTNKQTATLLREKIHESLTYFYEHASTKAWVFLGVHGGGLKKL
jgi:hypothetical protein